MGMTLKELLTKGEGTLSAQEAKALASQCRMDVETLYTLLEERGIKVLDNEAEEDASLDVDSILAEVENAEANSDELGLGDENEDDPAEENPADLKAAMDELLDDPVKNYLKQIGQIPLLSAEQEVELSRRIHAGAEAAHILQADRIKYGAPEYIKKNSARFSFEEDENSRSYNEDLDDEAADLLRERDNQRLQAMTNYCQTTGCLRNYILRYFGEEPAEPCGSCGNCDREFEEVDMTAQAKWMINCVAETRGRYGKGVVLNTLRGANMARLRELGAVDYRSYGQLKDCTREELNCLLAQLLEDGYLIQTDDQYAVLRMGNIAPLKQGAQVLVKLPPKVEPADAASKKHKASKAAQKGKGGLTGDGAALFEQLRALRMQLAQAEKLPPYLVFGDKTLVDMCAKAPRQLEDMKEIYGMGERKFAKYGKQFFAAIEDYRRDHPDAEFTGA